MTNVARDFFPQGINQYVPAMQFTSELIAGGLVHVSLGTPTGADDDGIHADIDADGTLGIVYSSDFVAGTGGIGYETDAKYGQTVVVSPSADPGATGCVIDVVGEDYLGQPLIERLTIANTQTTDTESVKAFKRVLSYNLITAATDAITVDLGWGTKLGVPYKIGQIIGGDEGGVLTVPTGLIRGAATAVTVSGANAASFTSPIDGYVVGAEAEVTTAVTTAVAVMDAVIGGSGAAAADFNIPVAAAGFLAGVRIAKASWVAVSKGDTVVWTSNAGPDAGVAEVTPLYSFGQGDFDMPVTTDPQTATTGDPRGLYDPQLAPNGTREYKLLYRPNSDVNSDNNGGLHGIQHFRV